MNQLTNISDKTYPLKSCNYRKENMPAKLMYMFCCGRVLTDQQTLLPSYIDVFHNIVIPKNDNFWIQTFFIAGGIYNEKEGMVIAEVSFIDPLGLRSKPTIMEAKLLPGYVPFNAQFLSVKFDKFGRYYLKIKFQGEELELENKYYFDVVKGV